MFDEGHHLFDAADGAFAARLTGTETRELRRWLLGPESAGRSPGRAHGLRNRIEDLVSEREAARAALDDAARAARALPGDDWPLRLADGAPRGPTERFLALVRALVLARAPDPGSGYGIEIPVRPFDAALAAAAAALSAALAEIAGPLRLLAARLAALLEEEAARLESAERQRIEAAVRGIERRAGEQLAAWRTMLATLAAAPGAGDAEEADPAPAGAPEEFVDWFAIERTGGREVDVGMYRHHLDPTVPFAEFVLGRAQGALITSATLRDGTGDEARDWAAAEAATGGRHLATPPVRAAVPSPFDYAAQTRVLVITDVRRGESGQVAAAYRALFVAGGGGALGLFTAIARLRAVHGRIAGALDEAGIPLWAQHVDPLGTTTLVDVFRAEPDACLLGTDAVRDGVDVPGRSLRLIVFDRVPWPRPDILHRARRRAFGGNAYDDRLTRLRLKQAYGRLVRRADDRGVFVLLDPALPSRLAGAFPPGVEIRRVGLAEAVRVTTAFVGPGSGFR